MTPARERILHGTFLTVLAVALVWMAFGKTDSSSAMVSVDGATYRVTGPFTHENLAVFLIHGKEQDNVDYITLEEGLRSGVVKVTEKDQEQVNELMIENTGDRPLFLQEGDRIQGGKQDRIIYASHVVPGKSGRMPVSSFCVESSRWTAGKAGKNFNGNFNPVLAPLAVRTAGKVQKNQGQVWQAVAGQKASAAQQHLAPNTNSSLNETLDAPKVKQLSDAFVSALQGVAARDDDVIGVAIVLNGEVQEIDLYPNHNLLAKQYPRLLGSYALEAVLQKSQAEAAPTPTATQLCAYMWDNEQQAKQEQVAALELALRPNVQTEGVEPNSEIMEQLLNNDGLSNQVNRRANTMTGWGQLPAQRQQQAVQLFDNTQVPGPQTLRGHSHYRNMVNREDTINVDNKLRVVDTGRAFQCATRFKGNVVHKQLLANPAASPRQAAQPRNVNSPAPQPAPALQNVNP